MNRSPTTNEGLPSRHANPFATCWTRPGAIAFQFSDGKSAEQLIARLAAASWRGAIVGPHGSGKSTLVEAIKPHLAAAGRSISTITLRDGQRRLPADFVRKSLALSRPLIIVDGYERLSWPRRLLIHARCRRASAGLVVTSHAPTGLPLLYDTQPSWQIAEQLVSTLTAHNPSPVTAADVAASHASHGSNLRELLFALYDRHEALVGAARKPLRTAAASPA